MYSNCQETPKMLNELNAKPAIKNGPERGILMVIQKGHSL